MNCYESKSEKFLNNNLNNNPEYKKLRETYENFKNQNLKLDMSRGKPSEAQLDLSTEFFNLDLLNLDLNNKNFEIDGFDIRNYGCLDGLESVKNFFANLFEVSSSEIFIGGNSSLNLMHDVVMHLAFFELQTQNASSSLSASDASASPLEFLCPVPGYDRHFAICEKLGIKMINIAMTESGPNMNQVEALVTKNENIMGMWCVPQYSNPTGITYSDETVKRLANLTPKSKNFKIFWDNAYAFHHLYPEHDSLLNILNETKKNNKQDMIYMFSSTSKIVFPGSGISVLASSANNIAQIKKWFGVQTIGYDKINQLKHLLFLKNSQNLSEHMKKHADILRPKFEAVEQILNENLKNLKKLKKVSWTKPRGGYFISLDLPDGCAKKVVALCREAGVIFTNPGATFPYGKDPKDSNIRLAPSFPELRELKIATELLCVAIKMTISEQESQS